MPGLLESFANWAEPLRSASYYTRRDRDKQAEARQGLLAEYQGAPITMGIQHPDQRTSGVGGLLNQNQELPAQYYHKLSTLPGMENLASDMANYSQMMERQRQEQDYNAQNMTAAQAQQAELQRQQMQQQQDQWQQEFGNLSEYQKQALAQQKYAVDQRGTGAGGISIPNGYMPNAEGSGVVPIPGSKDDQAQLTGIAALERGIAAAQQGLDAIDEYGSFETGAEAKKRDAYITNELVSAQSMLSNSGILNPSEAELYASRVPQQNNWGSLLTRDDTAKAKLEALRTQLQRRRDDLLKAQGRPPAAGPKVYAELP